MNTILTGYESPVIQDPVPQVAATRAGALEVYKLLPERHWGSVCIGVNQKEKVGVVPTSPTGLWGGLQTACKGVLNQAEPSGSNL